MKTNLIRNNSCPFEYMRDFPNCYQGCTDVSICPNRREQLPDNYERVIDIAELFNADTCIVGNVVNIKYPQLGQGSIISQRISDELGLDHDYTIKMIPRDCLLEVSLY